MSKLLSDVVPYGSQMNAGKSTQSLKKWKVVRASMSVVRQFKGRVASGSKVGSAQIKLEKSNHSGSTREKPNTGALESVRVLKHHSTYSALAQDVLKQKDHEMPTMMEFQRNGEGGYFKAWDPTKELPMVVQQLLLTMLISLQIFENAPRDDSGIVIIMIIVIVIAQETGGTNVLLASKDLMSVLSKIPVNKKALLFLSFALLMPGAYACQDPTESRKTEDTNPIDVKAALTLLTIILSIGGAGVARRMCNRWRPRQAVAARDAIVDALATSVWKKSNADFTIW